MSVQKNISSVERLFKEGYNSKGQTKAFKELLADNVVLYDPADPNFSGGIEGFIKNEKRYVDAFPDKTTMIDDVIASDDQVIVRWTTTGTQHGDLPGVPASGEKIKVSGIGIYYFSKGKITKVYQVWDRLGLLQQLGKASSLLAAR